MYFFAWFHTRNRHSFVNLVLLYRQIFCLTFHIVQVIIMNIQVTRYPDMPHYEIPSWETSILIRFMILTPTDIWEILTHPVSFSLICWARAKTHLFIPTLLSDRSQEEPKEAHSYLCNGERCQDLHKEPEPQAFHEWEPKAQPISDRYSSPKQWLQGLHSLLRIPLSKYHRRMWRLFFTAC